MANGNRLMSLQPSGELMPYEKCEAYGPGSLSDRELIAVLLRTGSAGESSLELAGRVLEEATPSGLLGLLHYTLPELRKKRGI